MLNRDFFAEHFGDFKLASWYSVALSVLLWTVTYFVVRHSCESKSPEWCNRIITLLHGLLTSVNGLQECVQDDEWAFENPDEETSTIQSIILVTSVGYFIFDLGWCLTYDTETNLMIFHHIYSCIALYRVLVSELSGSQAACGLGAMELTNPFLQWRWFLRSEGYYNTCVFKGVEIIFILLFFFVRIILGTYMFVMINFVYMNTIEFKLLTTIIYILSWAFLINIGKFVYLKYVSQNIRTVENDIQCTT